MWGIENNQDNIIFAKNDIPNKGAKYNLEIRSELSEYLKNFQGEVNLLANRKSAFKPPLYLEPIRIPILPLSSHSEERRILSRLRQYPSLSLRMTQGERPPRRFPDRLLILGR
jgi:hypothetical protein